MADVALVALLRATSRKTDDDASRIVTWNKLETPKDLIKLKKRIAHAVERLNKDSDVAENESGTNLVVLTIRRGKKLQADVFIRVKPEMSVESFDLYGPFNHAPASSSADRR